jgi:N-acetylated-alpha-linked acidic dipeptidase
VEDPEKGMPVWRREELHSLASASSPDERERLRSKSNWPIDALGSGSDYTAFLDFVGIASLNLGYGGEPGGGVYHSAYDDFYWYSHFDDPTFVYGRALAQTSGTAVLRLADADLLPFNFSDLSSTVRGYVSEIEKLVETQSNQIRERNREIAEGMFAATSDPAKPLAPPATESLPPHLNFAPLENALDALSASADRYQRAAVRVQQGGIAGIGQASLNQVNKELLASERALTDPNGLPGRPWFKHQLYAPGFYTGYGVKTIPAVREAIEQKQWSLAEQSIQTVAKALQTESATIGRSADDLESSNNGTGK